jgi:hypothetical protein
MSSRYINPAVESRVLTSCARRCCLCFHLKRDFSEKEGQIAHLDHDNTNGAEDNLAFLCLPHHSLYDSRTSQHKNYTMLEVKASRKKLVERVESFESDEDAMDEESDEPIEECEEDTVLGPDEHKTYPFKMTEGQRIIGFVSSEEPIDVLICAKRDYEDWDSEESEDELPKSYFFAEDVRHRSIDFEAPRSGSFVVLLINWSDEETEMTIDWAWWDVEE